MCVGSTRCIRYEKRLEKPEKLSTRKIANKLFKTTKFDILQHIFILNLSQFY